MIRRTAFVALFVAGCSGAGGTPGGPTTATRTFEPTCRKVDTTEGHADDVDGDGTPDWIVTHDDTVDVYLRRGDCLALLTTIKPEGRVAFVGVIDKKGPPGVRNLSIDTWLFHGDRARAEWSWTGYGYESRGPTEEILGPRR